MTRACAVACALVSCSALPGCAALLSENAATITIHSEPSGALVYVDGLPAGITPLRVQVLNHEPHVVHVALSGLRAQTCTFGTSGAAGWLILDFLVTTPVGMIIDLVRGDWRTLDQTHCVVWFTGGSPPPPP